MTDDERVEGDYAKAQLAIRSAEDWISATTNPANKDKADEIVERLRIAAALLGAGQRRSGGR